MSHCDRISNSAKPLAAQGIPLLTTLDMKRQHEPGYRSHHVLIRTIPQESYRRWAAWLVSSVWPRMTNSMHIDIHGPVWAPSDFEVDYTYPEHWREHAIALTDTNTIPKSSSLVEIEFNTDQTWYESKKSPGELSRFGFSSQYRAW